MERYYEKGELEKAKTIGNMILSHFKADAEILIMARIWLARIYLVNGKKAAATDLLNQSISTLVPSEAVWQAWLTLAGIYEYDANFFDAFTIYKKVFTDCPKYLTLPWMARIKMGEIADRVTSEERPDKIFASVISSFHPFLLPRRIAQFYTGEMKEEEFKKFWLSMYPGNMGYISYFGRKSLIKNDPGRAREYFESYQRTIAPNTWTAMQIQKALSLLKK